jgi:plasmid stability protein
MPSILIRNVDEPLHARLKHQAVAHRRSLEEEVREILRFAVARGDSPSRENIVAVAQRLFGTRHGMELSLSERGRAPDKIPPSFSGTQIEQ